VKKSYFDTWYKTRACSLPIENCKNFNTFSSDIKNFYKLHSILKDNRKTFKKILGKPDTYWKGSEFYFHVWIREFKGEKFLILTAKGKGTCIEICNTTLENVNKKSSIIIEFIENLLNNIQTLS